MKSPYFRIAAWLFFVSFLPAAALAATYRIEAGGGAYTAGGKSWAADAHFAGGAVVNRGAVPIANTTDDNLFQTERYGMTAYNIPVAEDTYMVKLYFAETFTGTKSAGQRVFDVNVEGYDIRNIDVFAASGGQNKAIIKTVNNVTVSDGTLNIIFTKKAGATMVNAIEVLPVGGEPPTPTNGACGSAHLTATTTKPTTGLCSAGTPSAVVGTGPWTWSCAGAKGGTTVSCNAPNKTTTSDGRGRVHVGNGTVLTDRGTMLRGASMMILTNAGYANDPDHWKGVHDLGINAVRLDVKTVQIGKTPMQQLPYLDKAIDLAAKNKMYIMIKTSVKPGGYDLAALKEFWSIAAPRYKNRTHVIYEVTNEPVSGGPNWGHVSQWTDKVLKDLGEVHRIMRSAAPDTHITLFSTPNLVPDCASWKALAAKMPGGVNWSKSSISFHHYKGTTAFGEANLRCLMKSYPLLMTETN